MSPRLLKNLLAVAILLSACFFFYLIRQVPTSKTPFAKPLESARGLKLERGAQSVEFSKAADGWKVKLADGALAAVEDTTFLSLLSSLKVVSLEDVIATRADRHAELEVDAPNGIRVTVLDDKAAPVVAGIFGKQAPNFRHIYYRPDQAKDVYLASGLYRGDLGVVDPLSWRSRLLIDIPEGLVKSFRVEKKGAPAKEYVQVSTSAWTLNGKPVAPEVPNRLVGALAHLRVDSFRTPQDGPTLPYDQLKTARIVVRSATSQADLRIGALDKKNQRYPLSTGPQSGSAWLSQSTVDSLLK